MVQLQQRDVDFDIVAPGSKFSKKPDIIINLVTRDQEIKCNDWAGWAHVRTFKPVNTIVCATSYGFFGSTSEVSGTAAHEFIHAMGLGHAFNKPGDLMCSIENKKATCPGGYGKSNRPRDFDLTAVAQLYGTDGYTNPNNSISWGKKFTANEYLQVPSTTTNPPTIIKPPETRTEPPKLPETITEPPKLPETKVIAKQKKDVKVSYFGELWPNWIISEEEFVNRLNYHIKLGTDYFVYLTNHFPKDDFTKIIQFW